LSFLPDSKYNQNYNIYAELYPHLMKNQVFLTAQDQTQIYAYENINDYHEN